MGGHWVWWIAAAVLVGAELLTGTFYLLAVGIAAAIGGVAAWLGAGLPLQYLVAGGLGVVLTIAAHQWRMRQRAAARAGLARRRPGGARADLECRRHRARRVSRHALGRRARGAATRRVPIRSTSSPRAVRCSCCPTAGPPHDL